MAEEKKKKTIVSASSGKTVNVKEAKPVGNAKPKRVGAVILWVLAIAFEVVAILMLFGKISITFMNTLTAIVIALVLDLACVIAGSLLWKKANHIDPASEKNKVKFWLWNNMGLIVCAFAFIPFVILTLTKKDADKKTKTVATVVAVIALLIGGLFSYDWNPVSSEEKDAAVGYFGNDKVYWTQFGTVYHTSTECSHLNNSDTLVEGTVDEAIAANKSRLCKTCEKRDNIDINKSTPADSGDDIVIVDDGDTTENGTEAGTDTEA